MSSFSIPSSFSSDSSDDSPACFPVLDMFRRLASAGSLAMKQEKDHMMALVQSSSAGDRLKISSPFHKSQKPSHDEETEIVFSSDSGTIETPSEKESVVEHDDETLDTSSGSSSSSLSQPLAEPPVEVPQEQEQQVAVQAPTTQPQHHHQQQVTPKQSSLKKKSGESPSVFGLGVVMESEDEWDEEEPSESSAEEPADPEESTLPIKTSAIRWSDDANEDPNAVKVTVHEVECFKDRTDMWWQGSEFVSIKQNVSETIRFCKAYNRSQVELLEDILRCDCLEDEDLMKDLLQDLLSTCDSSSRSSSSSESFTRGLEGHLSKLINKYRQRHTRKVLSAQEKLKQDSQASTDEETYRERLREESMDKSELLAAFARRMGQFDEMVVAKAKKARKSLWDI